MSLVATRTFVDDEGPHLRVSQNMSRYICSENSRGKRVT